MYTRLLVAVIPFFSLTQMAYAEEFIRSANWMINKPGQEEFEEPRACLLKSLNPSMDITFRFYINDEYTEILFQSMDKFTKIPLDSTTHPIIMIGETVINKSYPRLDEYEDIYILHVSSRNEFIEAFKRSKFLKIEVSPERYIDIPLDDPGEIISSLEACLESKLTEESYNNDEAESAQEDADFVMDHYRNIPFLGGLPFDNLFLSKKVLLFGPLGEPVEWGSLGRWLIAIAENDKAKFPLEGIEYVEIEEGRYRGVKIKYAMNVSISFFFFEDSTNLVLSHIGNGDRAVMLNNPINRYEASNYFRIYAGGKMQ